MIAMVRQIETFFPTTNVVFPRGYHEVDCSTCHRGSAQVETKAWPHFMNRGDAAGRIPAKEKATNLKVLPPNTAVHGQARSWKNFAMFRRWTARTAIREGRFGPRTIIQRKDLTRRMIEMTRQINANFPGAGVYPANPQAVSCYTCHRGDTHPVSASNKNYAPPAARQ